MIPRTCIISTAALAGLCGIAPPVLAGSPTEVVSAFEADDRFDLNLTLDYGFEVHRAGIRREQSGFPGTGAEDPTPLVKDLYYEGSRHTLTPRLELGVLPGLAFTAALPVVLHDSRSLSLDQRDSPCVFPGSGELPTCIDRTNSSTIQDGLLPVNGFDAQNPGGPGFTDGAMLFRGPGRAGLDQLHLGLVWAAMDQAKDDTKPTWKLGAEARLAVGAPMKLDRANPDQETGVGRGLHELRLWTSFARQFSWTAPYVEIWWMGPFAVSGDSAFTELNFGQLHPGAQQQGGTRFGLDSTVWQRPEAGQRVSVNASALLEARFEGRAYTEIWEMLQYAGTAGSGGPLVLDANPTQAGRQELTHPGVTQVENHLRFGGMLGVDARIRPNAQVGLGFDLVYTQPHVITFSDAGNDLPTCSATVTTGCEADSNGVVNSNTEEVNPGHVPLIDVVGQRYRAAEGFDYVLRVEARILF